MASYRRWALADDFRSNYSLSHSGEKVKLTSEEEETALEAAFSVGLPGICGVDLVRDSKDNNKPYIVEANGNPSLEGVSKVTGVNIAEKIIIYLERIGRKSGNSSTDNEVENHLKTFSQNHIKPGSLEYVNRLAKTADTDTIVSNLKTLGL